MHVYISLNPLMVKNDTSNYEQESNCDMGDMTKVWSYDITNSPITNLPNVNWPWHGYPITKIQANVNLNVHLEMIRGHSPPPGWVALWLPSPSPRVCRPGTHSITNFFGFMGLPNFLSHGALLACFLRWRSAIMIVRHCIKSIFS